MMCGLLLAMASLDTEHGSRACILRESQLMGSRARRLSSCGAQA